MKRLLLIALVVLAAGCTTLKPHGKITWVDYSVEEAGCNPGGFCTLVEAKVRNSGNGTLAIGSIGVIALDGSGKEIRRNTSWVVKTLKPGESTDLRITISGTLSDVSVIQVFLSSDPMSAFSHEDRLGEQLIRVTR